MSKKITIELAVGFFIVVVLIVFGIMFFGNEKAQAPTAEIKIPERSVSEKNKKTGLANPASEYCEEAGGRVEIRTAEDGSQTGYCKFVDGKECEEWAYFRGECGYDMSKWKTYSSEQYGIELKYPGDWILDEDNIHPPTFRNDCNYENGERCASFNVYGLLEYKAGDKLKRSGNLRFTGKTPDKLIDEKIIKVSDVDTLKTEYYQGSYGNADGTMGAVRVDTKSFYKGNVYRFGLDERGKGIDKLNSSSEWQYQRELNAILSSVKFIK